MDVRKCEYKVKYTFEFITKSKFNGVMRRPGKIAKKTMWQYLQESKKFWDFIGSKYGIKKEDVINKNFTCIRIK